MTINRQTLTPRQEAILAFVEREVASKGYPPSVREIGEAVGLSSSSTVHSHLRTLEKKGYIRRDPSKPRALEILDLASSFPRNGMIKATAVSSSSTDSRHINAVPILGRVAAGLPILAEGNLEDTIPLPTQFVGDGELFMLEVQGDSMIGAGILSGDYVVVQSQETARNGEIIVAMIEDEATVKRFEKASDHVKLISENPDFEPIITRDVSIVGKVTAVFRSQIF